MEVILPVPSSVGFMRDLQKHIEKFLESNIEEQVPHPPIQVEIHLNSYNKTSSLRIILKIIIMTKNPTVSGLSG